jgi:hypothetical protein
MKHSYYWVTFWINVLLAPVYAGFVIWSIIRWLQETRSNEANLRARMGSIGLLFGVGSAILLLVFYGYLWSTGQLIAHGSALFILDWVGEGLAAVGFFTSLLARRWIRPSAAILNVVTFIQWYGLLIPGLGPAAVLSTAMYMCVVVITLCWLISFVHSRSQAESRPSNHL